MERSKKSWKYFIQIIGVFKFSFCQKERKKGKKEGRKEERKEESERKPGNHRWCVLDVT